MFYISKRILVFFVFSMVLYSSLAFSESDLGFFFKNTTQYQDVVIKEVRNASTIVLQEKVGEKGEVIKLIGLRAPDVPRKKREDIDRDKYGFTRKKEVSPLTPLEETAFEFVKELLEGQHVRLEFDTEKNDSNFITLAYVFLLDSNTFVNTEILRQGYAYLSIRPPNMKYSQKLREAYREARAEKRGFQGQ